jgi:hypothetical protein
MTDNQIIAEKDGSLTVNAGEAVAYINVEERKLEWAKPTIWNTPTIAQIDKIPLYINRIKELTNSEIDNLIAEVAEKPTDEDLYDFAIAILKKAKE